MLNKRLLFIGGRDLTDSLNHRSRHMAAYFGQRFGRTDLIGFVQFYAGTGPSSASPWYKAQKGISNLLNARIKKTIQGTISLIEVRDLYQPPPLNLLIQDLWRYINIRQVAAQNYDLAIFGNAENAWLAWLLKKSGRIRRIIYDDWDYYPGLYSDTFSIKLIEHHERLCARLADAVISVNTLLAHRRSRQGAKQVIVVPNGSDLSLFAKARQKVPHPPTLIYMGSLSSLWGVDLAIRAMPKLLNSIPNIRLLIVGIGPAENDLKELSKSLGVSQSVRFLGYVEYHDLPGVLAEADVGIASSLPGSKFRKYASPVKLMDYMAAGLPVIASRVGQTEITMQEAGSGILIDHSVEAFIAAAVRLLRDKVLYEQYSQAALKYTVRFDWNLLMAKAFEFALRIMEDDQIGTIKHT